MRRQQEVAVLHEGHLETGGGLRGMSDGYQGQRSKVVEAFRRQ
jgi:hypothetical protein